MGVIRNKPIPIIGPIFGKNRVSVSFKAFIEEGIGNDFVGAVAHIVTALIAVPVQRGRGGSEVGGGQLHGLCAAMDGVKRLAVEV